MARLLVFTFLLVVLSLRDVCSNPRSRRGSIPFIPKCPQNWNHPKCTCETSELTGGTTIKCKGITDPIEIKAAFSQDWTMGSQYLDWFVLEDSTLSSLPDDVFGTISFRGFIFSDSKISAISDNVFQGSSEACQYIWAGETDLSDFNFKSLNVLKGLTTITLTSCRITDVPDNAFGQLELVDTINLQNNVIDHLGQGAFASLPQLRQLDLSGNKIYELTNGQLKFNMLKKPVAINLANNNIKSIEDKAFSDMKQPPSDLNLNGNKLKTLKEEIFAPLLEKMKNVSLAALRVKGNPFTCDTSLNWLMNKPSKYGDIVKGLQC